MFFKTIFVLATVCVVNASVITINVFDDNPDTEVSTNPRDCDSRACDQLCRRLKFPGGACVNGRCKCDNFLNTEDDPEAAVSTTPTSCNFRACDQLCRRLKFPGGTCINGRCKCDNFLNTEDDPEAEITTNPSNCNFRACDQQCRRLGFPGGACVNGRCKCDNFLNAEDEVSEESLLALENSVLQKDNPDTEVSTNPRDCNFRTCDQLCRRLKFPGGACVNGRCKCDNFLNTEDDSEAKHATNPSNCDSRACDQLCRRLKFPGGACVNGRCKCDNFLNTEDGVSEKSLLILENSVLLEDDPEAAVSTTPSSCNFRACDQLCRRLKFHGGTCVNGRCKCDNFLNTEDEVSEKSLLNLENSVLLKDDSEAKHATNPSNCDSRACDQLCRRLKFPGGACVNGRCKCDNFLNTEDEVSEKSLLALDKSVLQKDDPEATVAINPSSCNPRACDQLCRRLKFPGGTCVNGRCKCDNFLNSEDGVSEKSLLNLENSVLLKDDSEAKLATNPSNCDSRACDQLCRRLKFPGGTCVNGRCKCDNFLNTEASEITFSNLEDSVSPRSCNNNACNELCRKLKFREGVCIAGRCRCNNIFPLPKDENSEISVSVSESSKNQTEPSCNSRTCSLQCRRLKFPSGTCVNGRCKCNYIWRTEDLSLLSDASSEDLEELNLVLRTNEEELTVPSPSACNTVDCNEMCHRLKYIGGICRGGVCLCY